MSATAPTRVDRFNSIGAGDPAPWFKQRSIGNPSYAFDTVGGRYAVLCFLGSAGQPAGQAALAAIQARRELFDDSRAVFFGVTLDPEDEAQGRIRESIPGIRFFLDYDGAVSRLYGAIPADAKPGDRAVRMRPFWAIVDPTLRIAATIPFAPDGSDVAALYAALDGLPPPSRFAGIDLQAPILYLPGVFEPELCGRLADLYEAHGGVESGFMRDENGRTVERRSPLHKSRKDYVVDDEALRTTLRTRILRRVVPEIVKAHQFHVTRMERYIVACYAAEDGGHFRAHRDNTTKGTAHRRFAVSINLNDAFEGGEVSFPEYGPRSFKPPPGGAVVFSCSLLHAVSKVTAGRRYAFLPFLYDDAAAKLREENARHLGAAPAEAG